MENESLKNLFCQTLRAEAQALERTAELVQESTLLKIKQFFEKLLLQKGQLVVSGVGKSGLVAQKMASTFSSLGLPSFFLHPVEALHGDIGRVRPEDGLFIISKSGTTEELLTLLRHWPTPKEQIVALLGNIHSSLATKADIIIDCSVEREACLNNLAPTTSTTTAMAVGDSLAVLFESLIGLSREDFALNHPAGLLGKSLTLKVKDLMIPIHECPTIGPDEECRELFLRMTERPVGLCAVIDCEKQLLGIVVDGDIRRLLTRTHSNCSDEKGWAELTVNQFMNPYPITISTHQLAYEALNLMERRERQITVLPVLDGKYFVGVLRLHDLIRVGLL